jgi:1,4-dihydroxy-2-naphthoate octaprenyltransferase
VLVTLLALPLTVPPIRAVAGGAAGRDLVAVLIRTGRVQLGYGLLLTLGLLASAASTL